MRKPTIAAMAGVASCFMAACAIHPLPEDVTLSTYDVARTIRCEARKAVRDKVKVFLQHAILENGEPDLPARAVGARLIENSELFYKIDSKWFTGLTKYYFDTFKNSAVAYDFTFDMTEVNNVDANIDLLKPFTTSKFSAALTAGLDRTRQNIRTFTITDTFIHLMKDVEDRYCAPEYIRGPNYAYPIAGRVGIDEMIDTFVDLTLFAHLDGDRKAKGPPTMGDTIKFTTKISGGATPKIELSPIGQALRVASASIAFAASRQDVHTLIVCLSLPTGAMPLDFVGPGTPGFLVGAVGTPAERSAAKEIERVITRFELGRNNVVIIPSP